MNKIEKKLNMDDGYLVDFISGQRIKATPEEIDAVQIFSKQLVEDYNYPKEYIQTRPQFRVKASPSDKSGKYPVDISVFLDKKKTDDTIYIIVECKKKNRVDGKSQLEDYLRLSKASLGVWFNGNERVFLRKIEGGGKVNFEEIPNIPQFRQRIEDVGKFRRSDLKTTHNLKATFKSIRNYLAANTVGATRDEVLAQQIINIVFCKIYDEKFTKQEDFVTFRAGMEENAEDIKERILSLFENVKREYKEILDEEDTITLDGKSISYVVGELQNYSLMEAERDIIADAFEIFIGHALKGGQGQFFTPRNIVKMMVKILDLNENDLIIDPACGSGGFLIEALRYVWLKIDIDGEKYGWSKEEVLKRKQKTATEKFRGIDKDYFLSKVTKAYMTLIGDGTSGVVCDDSLESSKNWKDLTKQKIELNKFDVVITNPPFGAKIPVSGEDKLKQYDLGHKWAKNKKSKELEMGKIKDKEAPQILFIERCLQLLKEGGRMGIVLPDGIFGNTKLQYIRNLIAKQARIIAIIDIPVESFAPHTPTKTSIMFLQKTAKITKDYPIFMCIAETCGHDRRGIPNGDDDILKIPEEFKKWSQKNKFSF